MKIILTDNSYSIDGTKSEILASITALIRDQIDKGNFTKGDIETLVRIITSSKEDLKKEVEDKRKRLHKLMDKVFEVDFETLAKRVMNGEDINDVADEVTKEIFRKEEK